jgi:pyruvate kinase
MVCNISRTNLSCKTKIVCTMGPSSSSATVIAGLLKAGMDVARINFSHGSHREHLRTINTLREVSKQLDLPIAIMQDLPGPKDRTGKMEKGGVALNPGEEFTLTTRSVLGNEHQVSVELPDMPRYMKVGDNVFLGDGIIKLEVQAINKTDIQCKVISGGRLNDSQGINVPGTDFGTSSIGEDDWTHLDFGVKHKVDFVAVSFIKEAEDILRVKRFLQEKKAASMLIAKIERREALDNLDSILEVSDGVMVARGDLGIDIPIQKVPIAQKEIIKKCNQIGKPVIVATQMLESMVDACRPTRAEVTDIANAIFDGADAVMLSEETAVGKYPLEAVSMMAEVAIETEAALPYDEILVNKGKYVQSKTEDAISYAACHAAHQLGAAAIVAFTSSGSTARRVARYRPQMPILAITPTETTRRQLLLSWGVIAFKVKLGLKITDMFAQGASIAKDSGLAKEGDLVVITGGVPVGRRGSTNLLKVETVV